MSNTLTSKLIIALSVCAGVLISHGFSTLAAGICLYAAGTAFIKAPRAVTVMCVAAGGISILSFSSGITPVMLSAGAALAIVFSVSGAARFLFFLSSAAVMISCAVAGIVPLTAAFLAASLLKCVKWRGITIASGFTALFIISGLPAASVNHYSVSEVMISQNTIVWQNTHQLNLAMPRLLLQSHGFDPSVLTLQITGGGVRDSSAVGYVESGDRIFRIYSGLNKILIERPDFPVSIRLSRRWKPFTHPVIYVDFAEAML